MFDPDAPRDLQPLPKEHAVAAVQARGEVQASDKPAIRHICQLVGNLPLALRLVGRYLALHQEEAEAYLQWLRESPLAALDQGTSQRESVPVLRERSVTRLSEDARHASSWLDCWTQPLLIAPSKHGDKG